MLSAFAAVARDLHLAIGNASALVHSPAYARTRGSTTRGAEAFEYRHSGRVTPPAERLVLMAAWLLPAPDRARFGEEYRAELWEIAQSGVGCRQQLGYALRQLVRAVPLRFAVLAPGRSKAPL